jgi:hypothetical protein
MFSCGNSDIVDGKDSEVEFGGRKAKARVFLCLDCLRRVVEGGGWMLESAESHVVTVTREIRADTIQRHERRISWTTRFAWRVSWQWISENGMWFGNDRAAKAEPSSHSGCPYAEVVGLTRGLICTSTSVHNYHYECYMFLYGLYHHYDLHVYS